jgi:hypothetical protein
MYDFAGNHGQVSTSDVNLRSNLTSNFKQSTFSVPSTPFDSSFADLAAVHSWWLHFSLWFGGLGHRSAFIGVSSSGGSRQQNRVTTGSLGKVIGSRLYLLNSEGTEYQLFNFVNNRAATMLL